MRMVLALVVLVGCGDDGPKMMTPVDGGDSDANPSGEVTATFEPLTYEFTSGTTNHVLGPDGRIYAFRSGAVVATSDGGATYTTLATPGGSALVATQAALFSFSPMVQPKIVRSTDNGATFAEVTTPADTGVMATTPTTLWVEAIVNGGNAAPRLYRSVDQGDTFTEIALPPAPVNNRWRLITGGEYLFLESNGRIHRTTTGATWDDLGTITGAQTMIATHAGTALVETGALHRRAIGDTAWTMTPVAQNVIWTMSQRPNGEIVRVSKYTGAIQVSSTDGVAWAPGPAASLTQCTVLEHHAFDTGILGSCFDATATIDIRLPIAATQWLRDEADGLPPPQYANYTDISFTAAGRIVLAAKKKIFTSDDRGATWSRSAFTPPDDSWPINAIAVSPNGQSMFVGSTTARYAFLDGAGTPVVGPGRIGGDTRVDPTEHVSQAQWMTNDVVIVTTANTENTKGTVLQGDPDGVSIWNTINPYARESNPQFDPTAGFHGLTACEFAGGHALVVGVHSWQGTNSYQTNIRVKYVVGSYDLFMDIEPPVSPHIAHSRSCAPNGTHSATYGSEFLYVGDFRGQMRRVTPSSVPSGGLVVAKFAPDNHLWVITGSGVFRSAQPLDVGF